MEFDSNADWADTGYKSKRPLQITSPCYSCWEPHRRRHIQLARRSWTRHIVGLTILRTHVFPWSRRIPTVVRISIRRSSGKVISSRSMLNMTYKAVWSSHNSEKVVFVINGIFSSYTLHGRKTLLVRDIRISWIAGDSVRLINETQIMNW